MNFPWGPMTPEERAEAEKRAAEANIARARKVTACLPHLREAQRSLRECAALGMAAERLHKAQKNLAVLIEDAETDLVRDVT